MSALSDFWKRITGGSNGGGNTPGGGGGGGSWGPTSSTSGTITSGSAPSPVIQPTLGSTPTNQSTPSFQSNFNVTPTLSSTGTPTSTSVAGPSLTSDTSTGSTYSGLENSNVNIPNSLSGTGLPNAWDVFGAAYDASNDSEKAQLAQIMAEYDRQQALYNNQIKFLGEQKTNQLGTYNTQLQGVLGQIDTAGQNAERDVERGTQNVYDTAKGTQRSNRNVLRALGILGSSAGGEMLTKPMDEASKQSGIMQEELGARKRELDTMKIQKQEEFANAVKDLETNYTKLVSDIQIDQRYSNASKMAAIQQLNAATQQRVNELQQAEMNWKYQLAAAEQQFAMDLAKMQSYQGITPDYNKLYGYNLSSLFSNNNG